MSLLNYLRLLQPKYLLADLEVRSLNEIDIKQLKNLGIEALLFDVDGTISKFHGDSVDEHVAAAYSRLKENFKVYIVSNSPIERRKKLHEYFKATAVQTEIKKPAPEPFEEALNALGIPNEKVAMIGDRYLTDIVGANNIGLYSIKVKCLDLASEPRKISLIRGFENIVVNCYKFARYIGSLN